MVCNCRCSRFRTPRSAPISPHDRVSNQHRALQWLTRQSSDRNRASTTPRVEERLECRETNAAWVWGSPWDVERAPRKFGWWGAKQAEEKNTPLTMSDFNFPQFT